MNLLLELNKILDNEWLVNNLANEKVKTSFEKEGKLKTTSKKSLLLELSKYCVFEEFKEGRKIKYKITEIFDKPKKKATNYKNCGQHNIKLPEQVGYMIVKKTLEETIEKNENFDSFNITKKQLLNHIGLITQRFKDGDLNRDEVAKNYNVTIEEVNDMYHRSSKLESQTLTTLRSLDNKRILCADSAFVIGYIIPTVDEKGRQKHTPDGKPLTTILEETHVFGSDEVIKIKKLEAIILKSMNLKDMRSVYFNKAIKDEFYARTTKILKARFGIAYYYKTMQISLLNEDLAKKYINDLNKYEDYAKLINNYKAVQILIENTKKHYEKILGDCFGECYQDEENKLNNQINLINGLLNDYDNNELKKELQDFLK